MPLKLTILSCLLVVILSVPISVASVFSYYQAQDDTSQTNYALGLPLAYFISYQVGMIYALLILNRYSLTSTEITLVAFLNSIWINHYRLIYPIIIVNEIFSFMVALNGSFDPLLPQYTTTQLFFYALAFFVCNHAFSIYSRGILRRTDIATMQPCDQKCFHSYEYVFYFQTLIIFVCFYYSIKFDELDASIKPLIKFLINHLMFHIFQITRITLIVNIFITAQFLQVVIDGITLIVEESDNLSYILIVATALSVLGAFIYNLHILGQYYLFIRQCREGRPVDMGNPPVAVITTDCLREEELQKLEVRSFHTQVESAEQAKPLCSVCSCEFTRKDRIVWLECQHCFHSGCVFPWLRLKNSCPNCRSVVIQH